MLRFLLVSITLWCVSASPKPDSHGRSFHEHLVQIQPTHGDGGSASYVPQETQRGKRQIVVQYLLPGAQYPHFERTPTVDAECKTYTTGEPGICKPLSECYPVLYTRADENGVRNLTNLHLAEDLMETAGVCKGGEAENIICCKVDYLYRVPEKEPEPLRIPDCSVRVVQGTPAKPGTFPWMAALIQKGRQFCGGSLIDDQHILTAAHCVQHMTAQHIATFQVYLGATKINVVEPTREVYTVKNIWYHRGFSMQTLHNDVAVLRLSKVVRTNNENIQPICLSTGSPAYDTGDQYATLSGWGKIRDGGPQSNQLLMVKLRMWKNSECKTKYGNLPPAGITDGMVCAGGSGGDACQGDSGGPLVRDSPVNRVRKEQIGIVSWGVGCGTYPGVYTRVDRFRNWIDMVRAKY